MREVLWFQRRHLIAGCTQSRWHRWQLCSECKTNAPAQRISCVFLCIFMLLQSEMRSSALQLSPQLRWGMKGIFPHVHAPNAGRYSTRVL